MPPPLEISRCPADQRRQAFKWLHDGLVEDDRVALVAALESVGHQGEAALDGLLVAEAGGELQDVAWVQLLPGRAAHVWPPATSGPYAVGLMQAISTFLDERRIQLAQILVRSAGGSVDSLYAAGGFEWLVDLAYLTIERADFPEERKRKTLQFVPDAAKEPQRLEKLILSTYEGSLDCPRLNGLRDPADVVESYRAQGKFVPENWYVARQDDQDAGVLILAKHDHGKNLELVYMGVLPAFRGRRIGQEIVEFALERAQSLPVDRVVLAVDKKNSVGLSMYHKAGFSEWDFRKVFARMTV